MLKLFKINIIIFLICLIILFFFLESLNYILGGVPIYKQLNLNLEDIIQVKLKDQKYKDSIQKININNFLPEESVIKKCGNTEDGIYNLFYKPDKFGFRNNENSFYEETDIILLGDSFVFSDCINAPYDFTSKLRILSNKRILNLGVSGTAVYSQFLHLKKFTQDTKYETVIHFFYEGNDYEERRKNTAFINLDNSIKLSNIKDLKLSNVKDLFVNKKMNSNVFYLKQKIYLAEHLRGLNTLTGYFRNYPALLEYSDYEDSVKELAEYLDNKKIKSRYVYYIPKYTRIALHKTPNHPQIKQLDDLKASVKKIYEENNFKFIDGVDEFNRSNKKLLIFNYELPTHFNKIGYEEMAIHINYFIK